MTDSIYYNKDGYKDPTAYMAMIKTGGKLMDWKEGMLIKMESFNGAVNYRVIIKVYDDHATTLPAYLTQKDDTFTFVVKDTRYYCTPANVGYMQARNFASAESLGQMEDDDFFKLLKAIAESMGVKVADDFEGQWSALVKCQEAYDILKSELEIQKSAVVRLKQSEADLKAEVASLQITPASVILPASDPGIFERERDLYKSLYENLLDKLVSARSA